MSALGFSLLQGDIPRSIRLWRIKCARGSLWSVYGCWRCVRAEHAITRE
ncbi:MAG TPA: hypothetical protein VFR42_09425 [Candidatus Acidoferrum sp.]|nr:hypothetical protein [Candidatus Acidoferrum sp.]